jgi:tetratricopeptide (TPR) repeat protein
MAKSAFSSDIDKSTISVDEAFHGSVPLMVDSNSGSSDSAPAGRFVVLRGEGNAAIKIGIVSWQTQGDQCHCQIQAGGTKETEEIQAALGILQQNPSEASARPFPLDKFRGAFEQHGFRIEVLPSGDLEVRVEYDQLTGHVVGRGTALHAYATFDEALARRIQSSIDQALERPMSELATALTAAPDVNSAAQILRNAEEAGTLGFAPTRGVLEALQKFDVAAAGVEDRKFLRTARFEVAQVLKRHDVVADEAEALLAENPDAYSPQQRADLETAIAIGLSRKGRKEAALAIWRRLLEHPEALAVESRAWIWRNIAVTLGPSDKNKLEAAKQSADAFLEAGNNAEAGTSLMMLVDLLMKESPQKAVARLDEIIGLVDREGMRNERLRAAAYHARARRLLDLHQFRPALEDAERAIAQWQGLIGLDSQLVSSLHLAAIILTSDGKAAEAKKFTDEADKITTRLHLPHFELANQVTALLEHFEVQRADDIERAARVAGNAEILAAVVVARAMRDPALEDDQRLNLLEEMLGTLERSGSPNLAQHPLLQAIATLLSKMGQFERAAAWWERITDAGPLDLLAPQNLLHCYEQLGKWYEAEQLLQSQIALRGEMPGLLFVLGRVLYSAGKANEAVTALNKSVQLAVEGSDVRKLATELREKVLAAGGLPMPPKQVPSGRMVDRDEFERALEEFRRHTSSDQRMQFWRKSGKKHVWIKEPERFAKSQLHTFLKGKFGEYSAIFEEIDAGAGRLDLYVQLSGGLNIVIELKMCGARYGTRYAASGEGQILHYLEHKNTKLGYLVVFDARIRANCKSLISLRQTREYTVRETLIDVRPSVQAKAAKFGSKRRNHRRQ